MSYYAYRSSPRPNSRKHQNGTHPKLSRGAKYIDPSLFVRVAKTTTETETYQPTHAFNDFEISDLLKSNLASKGYKMPSPIQDQTIPIALKGRDVIGIADTGTGKTAAFAIPVLQKLIADKQSKALIIVPTRELAQQIELEFRSIAKGFRLFGAVLIGGTSMGPQLRDLRSNPSIVIGTPGRIYDHLERGTLRLNRFNLIVLDEVDRMLDMGFINDVRRILGQLSENRQSLFFSATMDDRVSGLIKTFANDPMTVSLKTGKAVDSVHQDVVHYANSSEKIDKLYDILVGDRTSKVIVFDETKRSVDRLSKELVNRGFLTGAIHGGKSQGQRQRALARFKNNEIRVLVATDVAARGIDVSGITHVINYSQPKTYEDYIHRIGRAGRAGKTGHALTFVYH